MALSGQTPTGSPVRLIKISVHDRHGQPASAAEIDIAINGRPSGSIFTGWGVDESTIEINDPNAYVELQVTVAGQTQRANLPPGQDPHTFQFQTVALYKAKPPPVARCPDGTTGAPCVTCRDGNHTWRICT
jgi:hypothetical protein